MTRRFGRTWLVLTGAATLLAGAASLRFLAAFPFLFPSPLGRTVASAASPLLLAGFVLAGALSIGGSYPLPAAAAAAGAAAGVAGVGLVGRAGADPLSRGSSR